MRPPLRALLVLPLLGSPAAAQVCDGNGVGEAYITTTAAVIGGTVEMDMGSPSAVSAFALLSVSSSFGPIASPFPVLPGFLCIDLFAPGYMLLLQALDPGGNSHLSVPILSNPLDVTRPPLFANALVVDAGGISISKTVRISWENPDGYNPLPGTLSQPRGLHRATALGADPRDSRTGVLVTGGGGGDLLAPLATNTTELYDPLTRTFSSGPLLSVARTYHNAVRLADGRVLICGGAASTGVVTATCELYDPVTSTLSPTGSMTAPRIGHPITLLNDGRVLVSGGLATYVDVSANFNAVLNTAQNTAEIYDPATGTWSAVATTMNAKRSGHTQTLLNDGRVLIAGGLSGGVASTFGGDVPLYTALCQVFDPATGAFAAAPALAVARGFHAASVLGDGRVLLTGGAISDIFFGTALATDSCQVFDGATWTTAGALPTPIGFHTQVTTPAGDALIQGGLTGSFPNFLVTADAGRHDGTTYTAANALGLNAGLPGATAAPRGLHSTTPLFDGTYLVLGGSDLTTPHADGFVYQE